MTERRPMQQQIHAQNSIIVLQQKGVIKKKLIVTAANITIISSQMNIIIAGNRNKVKIQGSAGKIYFLGDMNLAEIKKSWIACRIDGNLNQFTLSQSQFQLRSHEGQANLIPGILGDNQKVGHHRIRIVNMRNVQRTRSDYVKKLLPHLLKSIYNSSESRECSICYDDINKGDEVTSLFCFHMFHSTCILTCLQNAVKCPDCSFDLLKFISEEIKNGNFVQSKGELLMKESMEIQPS